MGLTLQIIDTFVHKIAIVAIFWVRACVLSELFQDVVGPESQRHKSAVFGGEGKIISQGGVRAGRHFGQSQFVSWPDIADKKKQESKEL